MFSFLNLKFVCLSSFPGLFSIFSQMRELKGSIWLTTSDSCKNYIHNQQKALSVSNTRFFNLVVSRINFTSYDNNGTSII